MANSDNSVSDRDIQSFLKGGDLQSLQELKQFGFDIILHDSFMTLMLDMNSIDIAFPHALSLIDCCLPMLHIIQITRIVEYMLNNARRYELWKKLTIQQRSQELLLLLTKMQQHYFKNNSLREFISDNPDRNNDQIVLHHGGLLIKQYSLLIIYAIKVVLDVIHCIILLKNI